MEQFRQDNTEGYTDKELEILNERFERYRDPCGDENTDHNIAEMILEDFDTEKEILKRQ